MRKMVGFLGVALLTGVMTFVPVGPASAAPGDFVCNGTFNGLYVNGSVTVPNAAVCFLANSHVTGSITVFPGGFLDQLDGSYVGGNVVGVNPGDFDVRSTTIKGAINVDGGTGGGSPNMVFCSNSIGNGVILQHIAVTINFGDTSHTAVNAVAPCTGSGGNTVSGSIQVADNTGTPIRVEGNSFSGGGTITGNPAGPILSKNVFKGLLACSNNGAGVTGSGNAFPPGSSCPNL